MKTGTCQVCFAAHRINKDGRMRKHVRERGDLDYDCPGSEFKPFEVDCAGVQWVFDSYIKQLAKTREQLLTVHLDEIYEPGKWVDPKDGFGVIQNVIYIRNPGEPGYEPLMNRRRGALSHLISKYKKALGEMERVINRYEPWAVTDDYVAPQYDFAPIHHGFCIQTPPIAA
jgi:hypothetical protein